MGPPQLRTGAPQPTGAPGRRAGAPARPASCSERRHPSSRSWTRGGADDRLAGHRQLHRMEDERPGLRSAQPAVERDQLLERAPLFELGVVEAVDHDVGDMLESVGPAKVRGGVGRERRQRIVALDARPRPGSARPSAPSTTGTALPRADQQRSRCAGARAAPGAAAGGARRSPRGTGGGAASIR